MDFDFLNEVETQNKETVIQADSILEAFLKTYRLYNRVDFEEIKSITHCSDEKILEELKEILIFNPAIQEYELVFDYLGKDHQQCLWESKKYHCNEKLMTEVNSSAHQFVLGQNETKGEMKRLIGSIDTMNKKDRFILDEARIKYTPYDYPLEDFFKGKRKEYQTDYFMMLTNLHTVEVISNFTDRIQVMKEYCELVLENHLASEVAIVSNVKFKTDNSKIKVISSAKYIKEDYEWIVVHDIESFRNIKAVMDKLQQSKASVLFLPAIPQRFWLIGSYLNQNYISTHSWVTDKKVITYCINFLNAIEFELPVLFHNQLFIHLGHFNYDIIKVDVPNNKQAKNMARRIDHSLDHDHLSYTQKELLKKDMNILGTYKKSIAKGSKFHAAAIQAAAFYLDHPSQKQIIYIDLNKSYEKIDYRQAMFNLLLTLGVEAKEICITNTKTINKDAKIFISNSRELAPETIEGLSCIHHLDTPQLTEMYIRNGEVKQILYLANNYIDLETIFKSLAYEYCYRGFNHDYNNLRQLRKVLKSFNDSSEIYKKHISEETLFYLIYRSNSN